MEKDEEKEGVEGYLEKGEEYDLLKSIMIGQE